MDDVSIEKRHRHTSILISTVGRKLETQRRVVLTQRGMKNTEYAVLAALLYQGRTTTELAVEIGVPLSHIGLMMKDLLEKRTRSGDLWEREGSQPCVCFVSYGVPDSGGVTRRDARGGSAAF